VQARISITARRHDRAARRRESLSLPHQQMRGNGSPTSMSTTRVPP
jgi:hypothetical protein